MIPGLGGGGGGGGGSGGSPLLGGSPSRLMKWGRPSSPRYDIIGAEPAACRIMISFGILCEFQKSR